MFEFVKKPTEKKSKKAIPPANYQNTSKDTLTHTKVTSQSQ